MRGLRLPFLILLAVFFAAADDEPKEATSNAPKNKLLLVSFDGFRYDLLNETFAPFITEWASNGTWFTNGVQSQYVTYTAPNHLSIITGLREDRHGIVSNYFYDPESKQHFDIFNMTMKPGVVNSSLLEHWFAGEPIWLTNQKSGGRSAVLYWPAGDAVWPTEPRRPSWWRPWPGYGNESSWLRDVDELVDQLAMNETNFATWYVAEPDHTLHTFGFYFDNKLKETMHRLDQIFRYLIGRLKDRGLLEGIDIILTADHGHAEILGPKNVMCIPDFVHGEVGVDFEIGDHMIYPKDEQHAKDVFTNLTLAVKKFGYKIDVHYKKDLPERFHYSKTPRVGEIIFEPEIGWAASFNCNKSVLQKQYGDDLKGEYHSSTHGMDPARKEMRALLVMNGPRFGVKRKIEELPENIDLYGLMAKLLGATPAETDGSIEIVQKALLDAPSSFNPRGLYVPAVDSAAFLFFVVPSVCIVGLLMVYAWRRTIVMEDMGQWAVNENGYKPLATIVNDAFEYSRTENRRIFPDTGVVNGGPMTGGRGLLNDSDSEEDF